ncbi:hypothetical protein U91I_02035 [alpha proteobacterium U9-1i]|nr:hypothetical protein U91I_02035 [alpha proteobacterium U9-1i]
MPHGLAVRRFAAQAGPDAAATFARLGEPPDARHKPGR